VEGFLASVDPECEVGGRGRRRRRCGLRVAPVAGAWK
jgi:hypothetical protein